MQQQLRFANQQIKLLQKALTEVLERQQYKPVVHPRLDIATITEEPGNEQMLSDAPEFNDKEDQEVVNRQIAAATQADKTLLEELNEEFEEIAEEHEAAHA